MMGRPREPVRLRQIASVDSPMGRALLAAHQRQPTATETRALEASVFGALAVAASAGTAASAPAAGSGTPALASAAFPGLTGAVTLKLALVLALGVAGGALGVRHLRHGRAESLPAAAPSRELVVVRAIPESDGVPEVVASATRLATMETPAAGTREHPRRASRGRRAESHEAPPSLVELAPASDAHAPMGEPVHSELQLIERARALLATEPARALQVGLAHERAFPRGGMREERDAIVISALLSLGRVAEARSRQATFDRDYPTSPYARRMHERLSPEGLE